MPNSLPIMFFSYASENRDPYLNDFFDDLCAEVAVLAGWTRDDERVAFRDKNNLRLMTNWRSHIEDKLQTCGVLVCVTSPAYFKKEFCGKEFYVFDQRRRQGLPRDAVPPPVVLPVIWVPLDKKLPSYMDDVTNVPREVADTYRKDGLRKLRRFNRRVYDRCVTAFAEAISGAWNKHGNISRLPNMKDFADIPDRFSMDGETDAAEPGGWRRGPEVANFVFAAGTRNEVPIPAGRYGYAASDWRPYLSTDPMTVAEHARHAAQKQSLRFREIRLANDDPNFPSAQRERQEEKLTEELTNAKERKNLTVLLADPEALVRDAGIALTVLEKLWWQGIAVVFPCDDTARWQTADIQQCFRAASPVIFSLRPPQVSAPIESPARLQDTLDVTLTELRTAVTHLETGKKEKTDGPPPSVTG